MSLDFPLVVLREYNEITVEYISKIILTSLLEDCLAAFWSSSSVATHLSLSVSLSVRMRMSLCMPKLVQVGWEHEIYSKHKTITRQPLSWQSAHAQSEEQESYSWTGERGVTSTHLEYGGDESLSGVNHILAGDLGHFEIDISAKAKQDL